MDGVIADFDSAFSEFFNGKYNDHSFHHSFENFIEAKGFLNLKALPGTHQLIAYLETLEAAGIPTEILSSTAGPLYHDRVMVQKEIWLKNNRIDFNANFVPGSQVKKFYATPTYVIIDDSKDVIADWEEAGGIAIWHKDMSTTLEILKELV